MLKLALAHLIFHHDALRSRFSKSESGWCGFNLDTVDDLLFTTVDLSNLGADRQTQSITAIASQLQGSLDITKGKMVSSALFKLGNGLSAPLFGSLRDRLLLIVHHLVVDGISWRILLEDLAIA